MDSSVKNAGAVTPAKNPQSNRSKISEISKDPENSNPNVTSPGIKFSNSPSIKSATKTQKSASKNPKLAASPSPRNKIRERKFVVAKRNLNKENAISSTVSCKCKEKVGFNSQKCLCVAYESLRVSQEEFFKNRGRIDDQYHSEQLKNCEGAENGVEEKGEEKEKNPLNQTLEIADGCEWKPEEDDDFQSDPDEMKQSCGMGSSTIKRTRDKVLEDARESLPEAGAGKVMHLVRAFERLLTIPKNSDQKDEKESEDDKKGMKWALPGLQQPKTLETEISSSSFSPSDFFLTSESLGLGSRLRSSLDSNQGRLSPLNLDSNGLFEFLSSFTISGRTSGGSGRRSRRNSSESSGTFGGSRWKKRQQLRSTSQKPFKLRTE
ncbi:hypothetical protein U1Q18_050194, partial [Sarracenia purpurea var. burkii]